MLNDVNDDDGNEKDVLWMRRALELADQAARVGEVPVGAVVVRGGVEIACGVNTTEREKDPCGHAEIGALRAASRALGEKRLEGCTLYVTLEPCAMCAGAMVWARIQRCVFGAYDPKGGFCGTLGDLSAYPGLNHHYELRGGLLADEASAQIKAFFAALRRR